MAEAVLLHHMQGLTDGVRAFAEQLSAGGRGTTPLGPGRSGSPSGSPSGGAPAETAPTVYASCLWP